MDGRLGSCPCGVIILLRKPVIFPPVSLPSDKVEMGREVVVDAGDKAAPAVGPVCWGERTWDGGRDSVRTASGRGRGWD